MELPILVCGTLLAIAVVLCWQYRWQLLRGWQHRALLKAAQKAGFQSVEEGAGYATLFPQRVRAVAASDPLGPVLQLKSSSLTVRLFEVQSLPLVARGSTCLLFQSPQLELPDFLLRPQGCLDKVGSVFGWQDLAFVLRPDFSHRYLLQGQDERAVRYYFSNDMLELFERQPDQRVEAGGQQLLVTRPKGHLNGLNGRQFAEYLGDAFSIFEKACALNQALRQADDMEDSLMDSTRELQMLSAAATAFERRPESDMDDEQVADKTEDTDCVVT